MVDLDASGGLAAMAADRCTDGGGDNNLMFEPGQEKVAFPPE